MSRQVRSSPARWCARILDTPMLCNMSSSAPDIQLKVVNQRFQNPLLHLSYPENPDSVLGNKKQTSLAQYLLNQPPGPSLLPVLCYCLLCDLPSLLSACTVQRQYRYLFEFRAAGFVGQLQVTWFVLPPGKGFVLPPQSAYYVCLCFIVDYS